MVYVYKMSIYEKNVSEPWFTKIKEGDKMVKGRLNKGDFAKIKPGDKFRFTNNELGFERKFEIYLIMIIFKHI